MKYALTNNCMGLNLTCSIQKDIQVATASEPLSLAEEYDMQRSWRNDADKLTFISCLPPPSLPPSSFSTRVEGRNTRQNAATIWKIKPERDDAPARMLGDVNLFLKFADGDEEIDNADSKGIPHKLRPIVGEIELMIAEKEKQRHGLGRASLLCFLTYIATHETEIVRVFLHGHARNPDQGQSTQTAQEQTQEQDEETKLAYLMVRIGATNECSLALFEGLGFRRMTDETNYFGELELRKYGVDENGMRELMEQYDVQSYKEVLYDGEG